MLRILDRYVLREVMTPFLLALLMLTFALEIPPILDQGERLIAHGASWGVVIRVLATLVPQSLGVTIPMALLVGILIALGRLSADREIVALEACGVSLARLLRPLAVFALVATAATTYVMIVALPAANQAFREITFKLIMTGTATTVRPRVFFTEFPNKVIYVRDAQPGNNWSDVVIADNTNPADPQLYLSKRGRLVLDEAKRSVEVVLEDGTTHSVKMQEPDKYQLARFQRTVIVINPESVFPRTGPTKGFPEMTIAELKQSMAESQQQNLFPHNQIMAWQKKYSIPAACLAFMLVALGMGVNNRREGRLASFVLGIGVVFVYYILLYLAEAIAKGGLLPQWFAWAAMWVPNIVIGLWGALLIYKKTTAPDRPFQFSIPMLRRRLTMQPANTPHPGASADGKRSERVVVVIKIPHFSLPRPSILDAYVLKQSLWISALSTAALLGLFYIATFIDLSDHLFKGRTTALTMLRYFWYATPQYSYYIIPLGVLMGALVTVGALTKNSELVVMKACGISLYRAAAPLLLLALLGSGLLMVLEEQVLAPSNKRADALNDQMRGRLPRAASLNRQWVAAENGNIYQYVYFDTRHNELNGLSIFEFADDPSTLARRTYLSVARYIGDREAKGQVQWRAAAGWQREFLPKDRFISFTERPVVMEGPGYFGSERPDADHMSYQQLREHVNSLRASGFNVVPYLVALHRKISFPFVTVIMALIAVPFAVTTGKHGAMYGIGAGIVLAILYWTAISVFAAIGSGGLMAPALAAWAPNVIFGCGALYLLLTVRT
jgi:LPS export ABC transporter permease LptG/LPS export ABC transporter permease LptF